MSENNKQTISNSDSKRNNEIVYKWIKSKYTDLFYEKVEDHGNCLVFVQEKPGTIERSYFGNFKIIAQPYSIYYFVDGKDTNTRQSATSMLEDICDYVEQCSKFRTLPSLNDNDKAMRIDVNMTPFLVERNDQGYVYMIELSLLYETRN